jgi:hypothetical protein
MQTYYPGCQDNYQRAKRLVDDVKSVSQSPGQVMELQLGVEAENDDGMHSSHFHQQADAPLPDDLLNNAFPYFVYVHMTAHASAYVHMYVCLYVIRSVCMYFIIRIICVI